MDKSKWKALQTKARRGDPESQWEVASYYEDGVKDADRNVVVRQNLKNAFVWYQKAAEQGHAAAQVALGVFLSTGTGVALDNEAAIYWTEKAFQSGGAVAAHNMATIYRDMGNYRKAFSWYTKAVNAGHVDSTLEIGQCYFYGIGVKQDYAAAVECFQKVATDLAGQVCDADVDDAHHFLGLAYLEGKGVKRNIKKARAHFETADKDRDHEASWIYLNLIGRTLEE